MNIKAILKIVRQAKDLDIIDLNYYYSSEQLGIIGTRFQPVRYGKSLRIFFKAVGFCASFIKQAFIYITLPRNTRVTEEILFFFTTINQKRALSPVYDKLPNALCVDEPARFFPLLKIYLFSLPFVARTFSHFFRSGGYIRDSFLLFFTDYLCIYGQYVVYRLFFLRNSVKVLVVANDHSSECTTIAKAARDEGITTVYIQHSSVSEIFPPLKFDYALLEGLDALQKYDSRGASPTKVFLIGIPKADAFLNDINTRTKLNTLGVCTNPLDPVEKIEELVRTIRTAFPDMDIIFRPHPGDIKDAWRDIATANRLEYSDPLAETSFDYLKKIDALVVGNSNIILEAVLMNVYPIYYNVTEFEDYYGFCRNGLVDAAPESPEEAVENIRALLNERPNVRSRARSYCDTLETEYDGTSAELGAAIISQLYDGAVDTSSWRPIADLNNLEAYRLPR